MSNQALFLQIHSKHGTSMYIFPSPHLILVDLTEIGQGIVHAQAHVLE